MRGQRYLSFIAQFALSDMPGAVRDYFRLQAGSILFFYDLELVPSAYPGSLARPQSRGAAIIYLSDDQCSGPEVEPPRPTPTLERIDVHFSGRVQIPYSPPVSLGRMMWNRYGSDSVDEYSELADKINGGTSINHAFCAATPKSTEPERDAANVFAGEVGQTRVRAEEFICLLELSARYAPRHIWDRIVYVARISDVLAGSFDHLYYSHVAS